MDHNKTGDDNSFKELTKRLKESENTYKLFQFSHFIIIRSIADIMDSTLRITIDNMYRKTKLHCKTDEEAELYRQQLCKLYLMYMKKGLINIENVEPKLFNILIVNVDKPVENLNKRLDELRAKIAQRMKRVQSLLSLQSRMKTDTVLAEWVISKVEPSVHEAENDLANLGSVSPNNVSILSSLNRMKNCFHSLELN